MKKQQADEEIRSTLLKELVDEVNERFGGNKTKAAEAVGLSRIQFTNICNGKDGTTIDKLVKIGTMLEWNIKLLIERKKEKDP